MNALELSIAIAEIEGVTVYPDPDHDDGVNLLVTDDLDPYNPLTDKALLWDLMVKYKVQKHQHKSDISLIGIGHNFICATDEYIPRAVLLAIIRAHADGQ